MEQYLFFLIVVSALFMMAIAVTYINTRQPHAALNRRLLFRVALTAPFLIAAAAGLGVLLRGPLKFLAVIGVCAGLLAYWHVRPDFLSRYKPLTKKYAGLIMAVIMAFLVAGCAGTSTPAVSPQQPQQQELQKQLLKQFPEPPQPVERGHGTLLHKQN
jgi:peptidoglycan/LPS O-acetylase OafA/YrhL